MVYAMKNNGIFAVLQKIGRAFMLPIAVLPMAGILLGVGGSFTNPVLIKTYNLTFLEPGTPLNYLMQLFSNVGLFVFANLPLLFAVGVAIGLANKNKTLKTGGYFLWKISNLKVSIILKMMIQDDCMKWEKVTMTAVLTYLLKNI